MRWLTLCVLALLVGKPGAASACERALIGQVRLEPRARSDRLVKLPSYPTLVYFRDSGDEVPVTFRMTSNGAPVRYRETLLGGNAVRVDVELVAGRLEVEANARDTINYSYMVVPQRPVSTEVVLRSRDIDESAALADSWFEADASVIRLEWADAVDRWRSLGVPPFLGVPAERIGQPFRLVGLLLDGRTVVLASGMYLGPDINPFRTSRDDGRPLLLLVLVAACLCLRRATACCSILDG